MPLKSKLTNIVALVLVLVLPLCVCAQEVGDALRIKTVVIDPGHGGKDPGAITRNGKYKEKDITLSVALKLGNMIKAKYPDIKVIYTRSTDKYVELSQRAAIANRNKADLFVSIHVNSAKATQARGTETFVMGAHKSEDNFEVCKTENSVIVIEDDYQTKYAGFNPNSPESYIIFSLLQNMHQEQSIKYAAHVQGQFAKGPITVNRGVKQGGLLVLWKTTMPAVLTELGFLSNPKDCQVLVSKSGQEQFARKIFSAFEAYMREVEKGAQYGPVAPEVPQTGGKQQNANPAEEEFYAVQILSVAKQLPKGAYDLRGRKNVKFIKVGNLYKYYIGVFSSRQDAAAELASLRKSFPGAFVIHIKGDKIVK
jgi:N-acetylmuramoyl-L-alanine amidase